MNPCTVLAGTAGLITSTCGADAAVMTILTAVLFRIASGLKQPSWPTAHGMVLMSASSTGCRQSCETSYTASEPAL